SYEIGVLLVYAVPLLRSVRPSDDISCYITAQRLLNLLYKVNPIPPDLVPKTSMLQEFIG
ncbi:MAG TPA: AAA family ATPase, partial [Spirochaetaceae bacterium]|nr:AAA family ATPase [Spirochaetaceae bacterium]